MKESRFFLHSQKLLQINYEVNPSFSMSNLTLPFQIGTEISVNKDEMNRKAQVILKLKIFNNGDISQVPFKLETSNEGYFGWDEELDNKVDFLLKENAPAILLSYVRPLITQFTAFSNYPPLIIPLIDFTDNKEAK